MAAVAAFSGGYALTSRRQAATVMSAPMVLTSAGVPTGPVGLGLGLLDLEREPGWRGLPWLTGCGPAVVGGPRAHRRVHGEAAVFSRIPAVVRHGLKTRLRRRPPKDGPFPVVKRASGVMPIAGIVVATGTAGHYRGGGRLQEET
ncbi:hypothetical protein GCM10010507_10450 [Streptomyces cinnamoneus]|uniref:Uncharacterized protein n=1 Tax=Streptomyces cinnamoneus TaxID=53446 RepID=A0A918WCY4_STRCJ|nr:hypothetical protein GCM10010507_10450 [Streptomyces cinnamoneus]